MRRVDLFLSLSQLWCCCGLGYESPSRSSSQAIRSRTGLA